MIHQLTNIISFSILTWQTLSEYDRMLARGIRGPIETDEEIKMFFNIGKINDEYLREKSEFYLGIKLGSDDLDLKKFINLGLNNIPDLIKYFDDNWGIKNISNQNNILEYENTDEEGGMERISDTKRIVGLHPNLSDVVFRSMDRMKKDLVKLNREYGIKLIFDD